MKVSSQAFPDLCEANGLPRPEAEFSFHPQRRWRFDFAWEAQHVALEIEGNVWASVNGTKSRHFHGKGILADMDKYNSAAILGWFVLRVTPKQFESGGVFELLKRAFERADDAPRE